MERKQDIDDILKQWPFDPQSVNVRMLESAQRRVLQMRVDMGILQLETEGRPDGNQFQGATTYFEFLKRKSAQTTSEFELDEDSCLEIDREFVQFYHRRVCWLQLKEFKLAVRDADHTLGLMDFCKQHSNDEQWTISHEQYRPFVLYHRTQAAALAFLNGESDPNEDSSVDSSDDSSDDSEEVAGEDSIAAAKDETSGEEISVVITTPENRDAAELAIEEVNLGLEKLRDLFVEYDAEEQFDDDELVERLTEFREGLREKYEVGATLKEQFESAVAAENYERAAELRDLLSQRDEDRL